MVFSLTVHAQTDPGKVYENNEDSVYAYVRPENMGKTLGILIVADGIGGHQAGEVASKIVIDTITNNLKYYLERNEASATVRINQNEDPSEISNTLLENKVEMAIQAANTAVYNYSIENPSDAGNLGSTVTLALIEENQAIIANVGDSRTYLQRNGELIQISEDHSYVATLVQKGIVPLDAYYNHPHRSVITRALGNEEDVEVDTWTKTLNPGDRLMLCSDGLWEMIASEERLNDMLKSDKNIKKIAKKLIKAANEAGGADNISVVIGDIN